MKRIVPAAPKLSDVARLAGVGNATVSRVLNGRLNVSEDKVRKVKQAISELGYRPNRIARSLKGASSGMIGMLVPSISDMFFSRCAEAVETVAREHGSLLIVMASHDDPTIELENLEELLNHRIDGLILSSAQTHNPQLHDALSQIAVPVVGLDRTLQQANLPSVMSENLEGARAATQHLLAHGYRTVLCILVKPDLYTISERCRGYSEAMCEAGLEPLIRAVESSKDVEVYLRQHVESAKTTIAVFAANNLTARYTWEAIRRLHLTIPTQVAVLSFDDFDLADTLTPPMSVVQQPVEDLGRNAAELLFQRMQGPGAGNVQTNHDPLRLPTRLIVRASCGCLV
ncbi:LacI family DNA-binding transcriptional regulator [Granulicella arctica]|uniref:LacI family DNA-binding transcriptional regulator n=1 Tax=Granulicella arctica TaxID=940613 RepID=UPI0021E076A2|nr:LacI family DNA-binding transcriptional regulator [Granulicella arctica]